MTRILLAAGLMAGVGVTAFTATAQQWNMATPYSDAVFHTENVRAFAADVADATGGGFEITVHSGGSLIPHPSIKRSVQDQVVEIGEVLISLLQNEDPLFGLDAIPFLATSYDQAWALWAASRPAVEDALAEDGLVLLYAVPWQPQGFYTTVALSGGDDLSGLRFRTYNAATARMAELLGSVATQVETPEIPQAFATGMVEAMVTSSATGVSSQAWDFVDYFTEVNAWLPKNMVVVNRRSFDRLDEAARTALLEAAAAAESRGWQMSEDLNASLIAQLVDNGLTVEAPTPALVGTLDVIGNMMTGEWLDATGATGQAIIDAYRAQ